MVGPRGEGVRPQGVLREGREGCNKLGWGHLKIIDKAPAQAY